MKKTLFAVVFAALLAFTLFSVGVVPTVAFAADEGTDYKNTEAYKFLSDFVTEHRIRSEEALAGSETNAANYLKEAFQGQADTILGAGSDKFTCELKQFNVNNTLRYNVVATLSADNADKQIIIGAHYDCDGGEGANDNASGITALYLTMETLLQERSKLPVNVVFVAFGAEELGMLGSKAYLSQIREQEKENTLAMFNFDVIANGDNLYVFCENKHTKLADFVLSCSNECSVKISEKPRAMGVFPIDLNGYGYYEVIQNTDFTPFRLEGIPTVAYFSGAYRNWDYVESKDSSKNTMNTDNDTLVNLEKNGALFVQRIESVALSVSTTVLAEGFLDVAQGARSELVDNNVWFNLWWPRIVVVGLLVILGVGAYFYLRKLQKRAILGTPVAKNTTVFTSPDSEDIFTFEDEQKKDKKKDIKDDVDDIFTFKK